jgi:hypothetical protein
MLQKRLRPRVLVLATGAAESACVHRHVSQSRRKSRQPRHLGQPACRAAAATSLSDIIGGAREGLVTAACGLGVRCARGGLRLHAAAAGALFAAPTATAGMRAVCNHQADRRRTSPVISGNRLRQTTAVRGENRHDHRKPHDDGTGRTHESTTPVNALSSLSRRGPPAARRFFCRPLNAAMSDRANTAPWVAGGGQELPPLFAGP